MRHRNEAPIVTETPNPVFAACGNTACLPWTMVPSGTVRIIERFGEFAKVARPGLHCLLPCFCECVAGSLSVRLQQLEASKRLQCETW